LFIEKIQVDNMPHKRSPKKLEARIAKQYAYTHSVTKHRNNDPDEMRERIFVGSPDKLTAHVLAEMGGERHGEIPDLPTGLVISDSRGFGFYDL
jgi:hypothetical protein